MGDSADDMFDEAMRQELEEEPKSKTTAPCIWRPTWEDDSYETSCGEKFVFTCDGPTENGMRFCPYCGKKLKVGRHEAA